MLPLTNEPVSAAELEAAGAESDAIFTEFQKDDLGDQGDVLPHRRQEAHSEEVVELIVDARRHHMTWD